MGGGGGGGGGGVVEENFEIKMFVDLRNESNIFSVDRGINQKRTENCINARSALRSFFG